MDNSDIILSLQTQHDSLPLHLKEAGIVVPMLSSPLEGSWDVRNYNNIVGWNFKNVIGTSIFVDKSIYVVGQCTCTSWGGEDLRTWESKLQCLLNTTIPRIS